MEGFTTVVVTIPNFNLKELNLKLSRHFFIFFPKQMPVFGLDFLQMHTVEAPPAGHKLARGE